MDNWKTRVSAAVLICAVFFSGSPLWTLEESSIVPAVFGSSVPKVEYYFESPRSEASVPRFFLQPVLAADAVTGATEGKPSDETNPDATTSASKTSNGEKPSNFFDRVSFHKFAGWTSGALFLGAAVVGTIRFTNLMRDGHEYRDQLDHDDLTDSVVSAKISELWDESGQALRWTHLGLVAAGETLYLTNAVTGIEMMTPDGPGLTRSDLHRYSFFVHGALMLAETILGVMTTEALRTGDHDAISETIGPAHIVIGFAIPAAIFTSGALIETGWLTKD